MMQVLSLFDLRGRKALVTGASRGLGQAIAEALASAGADVAITARKSDDLSETASRIAAHDRASATLSLDVRDVAACGAAVAQASKALGGLDILVNNAGYEEIRPSLDVDEALWDRIVATNLKGAFFCAQAAARQMTDSGKGNDHQSVLADLLCRCANRRSLRFFQIRPHGHDPCSGDRMGAFRHPRQWHCAGLFPHCHDRCVLRE